MLLGTKEQSWPCHALSRKHCTWDAIASHASLIPSLNRLRKSSSAQSCSGNDHQPRAGVLKRLTGATGIAGRTWWSSEVKLETKLFKSSNHGTCLPACIPSGRFCMPKKLHQIMSAIHDLHDIDFYFGQRSAVFLQLKMRLSPCAPGQLECTVPSVLPNRGIEAKQKNATHQRHLISSYIYIYIILYLIL